MTETEFDPRKVRSTRRYRRFRDRFMRENPLCVQCAANGAVVPSRELDHIIPVHKAPERFWDTDNMQALCTECHMHKSAEEARWDQTEQRKRKVKRFEAVRSILKN